MALLNYVADLSTLESKESNFFDYEGGLNPNDHRLIFSGDRHIYTHGVDFLLDYINGNRGLVPSLTAYTITNSDNSETTITPDNNWVLRKEGWGKFLNDEETSDDTVWSSEKTQSVINSLLSSLDAMVFKGILKHDLIDVTDNQLKDVPKSGYSAGWVYRVAKAGNYINNTVFCEEFDIIMAIADTGNNQNAINPDHWTVILNNISGIHNLNINGGDSIQIASNTTGETTFYAPNNPGTSGWFLVSTGAGTKVPNWISPANLNVGSSDKVNNNLTLGAGLSYSVTENNFYNGSESRTINLLTTTTEYLGGIKIGYDDSKTTKGVAQTWRPSQLGGGNYAVNVDTDGKAYVNVPWIDTIRDIKIGGTSIGDKALNIIPSSEIYLSGDNSSTEDTYELSLGLLWYNIGTGSYEPGVNNNPTTE